MPERARSFGLEPVALTVLVGAAVAALATARKETFAWGLLLPCFVALFVPLRRIPPGAKAVAEAVLRLVLVAFAAFGLAWSLYPVLPPGLVSAVPAVAGYVLALLAIVFLAGRSVWNPARGAVPAALGTLVGASFELMARLEVPVAVAAAAAVAYMAAQPPAGRQPERGTRGFRLAAFAVLAAGIAAAVTWFLPWAQPHVEQAAAQALTPREGTTSAGFPTTARLGDLEEIALSPRVALRVWTSAPSKLRARVFTRFDGTTWRPAQPTAPTAPLLAGAEVPPALGEWLEEIPGSLFLLPGRTLAEAGSAGRLRTRIVPAMPTGGVLLAPADPLLVRLAGDGPSVDAFDILFLGPPAGIYGIVSGLGRAAGAPGGLPAPDAAGPDPETLALPPDTDGRLRELAVRLGEGAPSPAERVLRTVSHIGRECRYALAVGRFRSRQPVAEFLFEKKRGYCEYFATAAAVLLRLQGVPARYVTGFNVDDANFQGEHYVVRESDAHAWIEVALPGLGWVEVDPTPAAQYAGLHPAVPRAGPSAAWEWIEARWAGFAARVGAGDWGGVGRWLLAGLAQRWRPLAAAALVAALAAAWRRRGGRRPQRALPRHVTRDLVAPEIQDLLSQADRLWARRGFRRPASRAPLEHLAAIPPDGLPAELRAAARDAVLGYYRAAFGGRPPAQSELAVLKQALDRAQRS